MSHLLRNLPVSAVAGLHLALASLAAGQTITQVHPAYTITSLRPAGFNPAVAGLDFLPDGRLVQVNTSAFGEDIGKVNILSGVETGDASKVRVAEFATGLNEPLGVKVVDGKIYVVEKHQLTLLEDSDGDGKADKETRVGPAWKYRPQVKDRYNLEFAMGLAYKAGAFYVGLATPWPLSAPQDRERGCIIAIRAQSTTIDTVSCGLRTPNGETLGPEDEVFATENQGNWVPASKLVHVKPGRFFGVRRPVAGPFQGSRDTPPVAWMPHGDISISPTQPVLLKTGPFAGQMVAGDNNLGTLQRFFLEKVKGEYQAAVFRFSGGLEAGASRIVVGPDSALYVGSVGFPGSLWGGWAWTGKLYGLQRMTLSGTKPFDWLAVRSLGSDQLELEFTEPLSAAAESPAAYAVRQWNYNPMEAYGQGKGTVLSLTTKSVTLSPDRKKAILTIDGLKTGYVVHIRLSGVQSQAGRTSWSTEAWYTLNNFGPGDPPVAIHPRTEARGSLPGSLIDSRILPGNRLLIQSPEETAGAGTRVEVFDASGKAMALTREGGRRWTTSAPLSRGIYLVVAERDGVLSRRRISAL